MGGERKPWVMWVPQDLWHRLPAASWVCGPPSLHPILLPLCGRGLWGGTGKRLLRAWARCKATRFPAHAKEELILIAIYHHTGKIGWLCWQCLVHRDSQVGGTCLRVSLSFLQVFRSFFSRSSLYPNAKVSREPKKFKDSLHKTLHVRVHSHKEKNPTWKLLGVHIVLSQN